MDFIFNIRKRPLTQVTCRTCQEVTQIGTPPGTFTVDFQCGDCVRQQRLPEFILNDEVSMYFVRDTDNGTIKQKLGSDTDPFSLELYQRLGAVHTATSEGIRNCFNRRRLELNPPEDANMCRDNAAETVRVEDAFKILSEPATRRKYNKFGGTLNCVIVGEGGFDQITDALRHMLGDGNFQDVIGSPVILPYLETEGRLRRNNQPRNPQNFFDNDNDQFFRVQGALNRKLVQFDPNDEQGFRNLISIEAEELRRHRNGVRILHTVGDMYTHLGNCYALLLGNNRVARFFAGYRKSMLRFLFASRSVYQLGKVLADCAKARNEEETYLARRWRTVSRTQELRENRLQRRNEGYWSLCCMEFEARIWMVCQDIFNEGEAPIDDLRRQFLERKAIALRIIGEIYET